MPKPPLTVDILTKEAKVFAVAESGHAEPTLFGVTDGKAVGTYLELKFRKYLVDRYTFEQGNAAKGIDFPDIGVDIKVTSIKQPQSSCPFKSARRVPRPCCPEQGRVLVCARPRPHLVRKAEHGGGTVIGPRSLSSTRG